MVVMGTRRQEAEQDGGGYSHQQAGFTAGTVADNNELPANLSHGACVMD